MRPLVLVAALPFVLLVPTASEGQEPQTRSPREALSRTLEELTECVRERGAEACMGKLKEYEAHVSGTRIQIDPEIEARFRQLGGEGTLCALLKIAALRPPVPQDATVDATLSCIESILDGKWDQATATEELTASLLRTRRVPSNLESELMKQATEQVIIRVSEKAGVCVGEGWFESHDIRKLADDCVRKVVADLRRESK